MMLFGEWFGVSGETWGKVATVAIKADCFGSKKSGVQIPSRRPLFNSINSNTLVEIGSGSHTLATGLCFLHFTYRGFGVSGVTLGKKRVSAGADLRDYLARGSRTSSYNLTFVEKIKTQLLDGGQTWDVCANLHMTS